MKFPILLAEDDENDVFFLKHAFQAADITHPVQVARDGQEAIDYLAGAGIFTDRARYPLPGLVLLDLKMPIKDGLEVLAWKREQPPVRCLPVIVFSSSGQPGDVERAYELGANAFVRKPPSTVKRIELARLIKGFWLEFNELPEPWLADCEPAPKLDRGVAFG